VGSQGLRVFQLIHAILTSSLAGHIVRLATSIVKISWVINAVKPWEGFINTPSS
jgi:hypothetical protein